MKISPIYTKSILFCKVTIPIADITGKKSIVQLLTDKITQLSGNKCIEDGYVSSHDIQILSFSSGLIQLDYIVYDISYECDIALPIEGMCYYAKIKSITKAGIHCFITDDYGHIPMTVFICNDQNNPNILFHSVKENSMIVIKVCDMRYQLHDTCIEIIADIIKIM
jgi:hypothetical protein